MRRSCRSTDIESVEMTDKRCIEPQCTFRVGGCSNAHGSGSLSAARTGATTGQRRKPSRVSHYLQVDTSGRERNVYFIALPQAPDIASTLDSPNRTRVRAVNSIGQVNGARVTQADIVATNGIAHATDAVMLPKNWQLLATAA